MPFFDGPRGLLHYRRWPVDASRAVVALLPGTGQHSGHYHRVGRSLGARDIETWALDVPGQGLSEGDPDEPGTIDELAADAREFVALVRNRCPGRPLFVAGHSLGAATALAAAPDCSGLVLTGTPRRAITLAPGLPAALPVLVLHGADDRRAPIDPVRDWTTGAESVGLRLREYADAGHDLLHEPVQAQVVADIAEWIQGVVAEPVRP
ncbi:alpha-beta hydrolase superfamily lysophospholipase [Nocardia transvalensis]|uniref:Alpha-beta hydrolase superfamily lysophospholipase n=1 Tax=Nocardia transvalensis TaxID=37333 RepID=A0A7W9PAB4_9NOCA|nr:alpha/beta fold hydrolase [Nocardia transvalensis]MBB5912399.1 alpha-beta hydrolase superfamily lysophospholipase [Nocardia transvalensis]